MDGRFTFAEPPGLPPPDDPEFAPHGAYITEDHLWRMDIGGFLGSSSSMLAPDKETERSSHPAHTPGSMTLIRRSWPICKPEVSPNRINSYIPSNNC
jgi:hypothetical protein